MAIVRNIQIDQGSTFLYTVGLSGNDNAPYDLTGFTINSQMRKSYGSNTISATFTSVITDPANGKLQISLTDEQTALLKPGRYVYDIVVESSSGDKYRAIEGMAEVNASVTR